MRIKEVQGKIIEDSRGEKTIQVEIKTKFGTFFSSSPSGKSKGKHEKPYYINSIEEDIKKLKDFSLSEIEIEKFSDLIEIETLTRGKIGSNSLFALESSILKALALENKKDVWQLINEKARKFPFPVGNCIGGGLHTSGKKKPDFQEFLIIPETKNFADNVFLMKKAYEICKSRLNIRKALGKLNDENAFSTTLDDEEVLDVLNKTREELEQETGKKIEIGVDIAASTFFTGLIYNYKNPVKRLKVKEQENYVKSLIENFRLGYIEDAFDEENFESFSRLRKEIVKERSCLIVGDDLIVSQLNRLKKALIKRSVNAIIVKPNQVGSLIEIKKLVDLAKKYELACVMSHRSGETLDYIIADLAFGFSCDFVKFGILGKEREVKLNRLIEIEKTLGI